MRPNNIILVIKILKKDGCNISHLYIHELTPVAINVLLIGVYLQQNFDTHFNFKNLQLDELAT